MNKKTFGRGAALRIAAASLAIVVPLAQPALAGPRLVEGSPTYANDEARQLVEAMVAAHGGIEAFEAVEGLSFDFFTKVIGNGQAPFLSTERTNFKTGETKISWPYLEAASGFDGQQVWSQNWQLPLPAGFFTGLTTSFITLPFLTQRGDAHISEPRIGAMPAHDEIYHVVTVTFDEAGPHVPGDYYEIFIDRETMLMEGIGFNITHPFMTRIAQQAIGPNYHRMVEYSEVGGLVIPTYYVTNGFNNRTGNLTTAMHSVFQLQVGDGLPEGGGEMPEGAQVDESTTAWWNGDTAIAD